MNATNTTRNRTEDSNDVTIAGAVVQTEINAAYAFLLPLLTVLTILTNLGIIAAFWKVHSLREKPSNMIILCLSVFDLLQGLFFLPIMSHFHISSRWYFGEIVCQIWVAFADVFRHHVGVSTACNKR